MLDSEEEGKRKSVTFVSKKKELGRESGRKRKLALFFHRTINEFIIYSKSHSFDRISSQQKENDRREREERKYLSR